MKLAEGEVSISNYPAVAPRGGGVQATLTSRRLVWLRDAVEEHYPLDKITCVTHGFERSRRSASWAVILLLFAIGLGIGLSWAQGHLPALAGSMVQSMADSETPERIAAARRAYERRVDSLMLMVMPLWGLAGAMLTYAAWLLYVGIRGETRVSITSFAVTRLLARRGRDPALLEFGERVAQRAGGLESSTQPEPARAEDFIDWIPPKR
jgi:hypothetical protein